MLTYFSINVLMLKDRERYILIKNSYYFPLLLRQVSFLIISYIVHHEQSDEARIW